MAAQQHSADAPARLHDNVIPFPRPRVRAVDRVMELAYIFANEMCGMTVNEFARAAGMASAMFEAQA